MSYEIGAGLMSEGSRHDTKTRNLSVKKMKVTTIYIPRHDTKTRLVIDVSYDSQRSR